MPLRRQITRTFFHIGVYVFGKDRKRTGATDSPMRFGGGGVCVRVHVRSVRAAQEDESGGADKITQSHLTDRAAHHQRRHAAVSAVLRRLAAAFPSQ